MTQRTDGYGSLQQARRAAAAWSTAYGDCPVIDQTGGKLHGEEIVDGQIQAQRLDGARGALGENLRKRVSQGDWNRLRAKQFERSPNCELCGSTTIGPARHAHEVWVYDAKAGVARLVGLRTVCRMCHFVEHPGFVDVMVDKGQFSEDIYNDMERHFCTVNKCKPEHYHQHQQQASRRYSKLERLSRGLSISGLMPIWLRVTPEDSGCRHDPPQISADDQALRRGS